MATLLEPERLTPEELRYDPTARALVLDLLGRERRGAAPGLRELAGRMGVVA